MKQGYFKVNQSGGSYVTATFYNPETEDEIIKCVRDYDYADCSRDDPEAYDMPIDQRVRRIWLHKAGRILAGDTVRVIKGRKLPVGTIGKVKMIKPFRDKYGRFVCDYIYFENGTRTSYDNCVLEEIGDDAV